jgi:ABC-type branched-subunit amino acid transport system substrate-binding protein
MKAGLEAALVGEKLRGKTINISFENDFYEPSTAEHGTKELIDKGIFLMVGNVGTPTAKATLPILAEHNVPAVGFFTGAALLRPGEGNIINYRASYAQEIKAVVKFALESGLKAREICAYVQNDSYGMAGLAGLKQALIEAEAPNSIIESYEEVLAIQGEAPERNNITSVGVYTRNTPYVKPGYNSLKKWERKTGNRCKLVFTAGSYSNVARFAKHVQEQGETWIISALSFTGADDFQLDLEEYGVKDRIIMTQVVPLLNSPLDIVRQAKAELGEEFSFVSLEGYIVGKMILKILQDIPGNLTRENFLAQMSKSKFNLGGLLIDFTKDGNQGSNLVIVSYLTPSGYEFIYLDTFKAMLSE